MARTPAHAHTLAGTALSGTARLQVARCRHRVAGTSRSRRKDLHHFPFEVEIESILGGGLQGRAFGRHFVRMNVSEDPARGIESGDLRADVAAVLAHEAQQV